MVVKPQLMPFDEINQLRDRLVYGNYIREDGKNGYVESYDDIEDFILEILVYSYMHGNRAANEMLGVDLEIDPDKMENSIFRKIKGKDWRDRLHDVLEQGGTVEDIMRIAETESHRNANEGIFDTATASGIATSKTWRTMMDDRVREQHDYMEGQTVPFNSPFVTYDGHETQYPGGFGVPELDINCRCYIVVS